MGFLIKWKKTNYKDLIAGNSKSRQIETEARHRSLADKVVKVEQSNTGSDKFSIFLWL